MFSTPPMRGADAESVDGDRNGETLGWVVKNREDLRLAASELAELPSG